MTTELPAGPCILLDADLLGADLLGADLPGADLLGANLPGADLPGADRGAHEHVIQHEEPALLGFHDLPPVVVDGFYHVVGADEVATPAAEKLDVQRPPRKRRTMRMKPGKIHEQTTSRFYRFFFLYR